MRDNCRTPRGRKNLPKGHKWPRGPHLAMAATVTLTMAFWLHYSHVLQIAHAPSRGQHSRSHSRSRSRSGSRSYSCSRFDVLVHKNPFTFLINIILGRRIEASSFPGSTRNRSVRVHVPHVALVNQPDCTCAHDPEKYGWFTRLSWSFCALDLHHGHASA